MDDVDVKGGHRQHLEKGVDDLVGLIEGQPPHLLQHAYLWDVSGELTLGPPVVDVGRAFEHLDSSTGVGHFGDLDRDGAGEAMLTTEPSHARGRIQCHHPSII